MRVEWIGVIVCTALLGCGRDAGVEHRAPTADGPAPHADVRNAAPLNNAAGYPKNAQAPTSSPHPTQARESGSERTARGKLIAAPGRVISGDVRLQEVADAVRVTIEVDNAPAGTRRVTIEDASRCDDLRAVPRASDEQARHGVGMVAIDEDGQATSTLSVPARNLRPDDEKSLLGKALVLHAAERIAGAAPAQEKPVACAKISAG